MSSLAGTGWGQGINDSPEVLINFRINFLRDKQMGNSVKISGEESEEEVFDKFLAVWTLL